VAGIGSRFRLRIPKVKPSTTPSGQTRDRAANHDRSLHQHSRVRTPLETPVQRHHLVGVGRLYNRRLAGPRHLSSAIGTCVFENPGRDASHNEFATRASNSPTGGGIRPSWGRETENWNRSRLLAGCDRTGQQLDSRATETVLYSVPKGLGGVI